jgi:hypothetical protein
MESVESEIMESVVLYYGIIPSKVVTKKIGGKAWLNNCRRAARISNAGVCDAMDLFQARLSLRRPA